MSAVRSVALFIAAVVVLGGCRMSAPPAGGTDQLPSDVAVEVATEPSICLIASDPDQVLMIITRSPSGEKDPGFLAVTVPGRPNEHDLAPGVDSRAVAGGYIVVGCDEDADMADLRRRAFADAQRRGVRTTLWVRQNGVWSRSTDR
jgi:hypothetical protein